MLPGPSGIPAAGDETVAGDAAGRPAPTPRPSLPTLLRLRARIAEEIGARLLKILDHTDAVTDEARQRIRGPVAASVAEAAPYLAWRSILHSLNGDAYLLRWTAALAALPVLFVSLLPQLREPDQAGLAAAIAGVLLVVGAVVGLLIGAGLMSVLMRLLRRFGGRVAAVAATAALLALAAAGLDALLGPGWFAATMRRGLWASAIFFASFLLVAQGLHLAQVFLLRRTIRRAPDGEVITGLLLALMAVETPSVGATDVANQLQQLADTVERALPRRFPGVHPDGEQGLREVARAIAAAVERMSMDVLLGGSAARAALYPRLGATLVHVAEGNWGALEQADPQTAGPARRLLPQLPAVVVAAVPLLVGLGLRSGVIPVDADQAVADYLVRFGAVWAALHLLLALDPRAPDKIDQTDRLLELAS